MKSKKVTMLAAALVVAVVAAAAIGYATAYTATTENDNNSLKSTYLTISQGGDGAYTDNFFTKLFYNTETTATKTNDVWVDTVTYKPVLDYDGDYTKSGEKTLALVSNVLILTVTPMNNDQETAQLVVTATEFTPNTDLTYTMIVATGYNEQTGAFTGATAGTFSPTAKTWTFTSVGINKTTDKTLYVALFISGNTTTAIETADHTVCAGFAGSAATDKTGFKFVLTANEGA